MNTIVRYPLLLSVIIFSGCSAVKHLEQDQIIENNYFSINWNTSTWDFAHAEKTLYVSLEHGSSGGSKSTILNVTHVNNPYANNTAKIVIRSQPYNSIYAGGADHFLPGSEIFFDKDADYEMVSREPDDTPRMMTINHYGKRAYNKKWEKVTYVQGMKCLESTFLRKLPFNEKVYKLYCGYYDKNEGKRILFISFLYNSRMIPSSNKWPEINRTGNIPHIQPFENQTKQAANQVINTLKIKSFDRERMEKEGLMHYEKIFEVSEY